MEGFPFLFGGDPFVVMLVALSANALFAGIDFVARGAVLREDVSRRCAAWLERRLNRPHRSQGSRAARGIAIATLAPLVAAGVGLLVVLAVRLAPEGWLVEAAVVALLLDLRPGFDRAGRVVRALRDGRPDEGRAALASIVPYDVRPLDQHGLARAAAEACARALGEGGVAAIFWYLLLGVPGLMAYRAIGSLSWTVGRPTPRLAVFGRPAASLARLLAAVPAALGGAIIALAAAFIPDCHPARALRTMWAAPGRGASAGHGWTLGAMAGALGLALGGPVRHGGIAVTLPWIGNGRGRATATDVARARLVLAVGGLFAAIAVALMKLASG